MFFSSNVEMKIYSIIVTIALVLSLFSLCGIGVRTGYFRGVMIKFGILPPLEHSVYPDNYLDGIPVMQRMTEKGWENCLRQMNTKCDIVFYGNSITANGCWMDWFPEYSICNLGLSGDNLQGLKRRIRMVVCLKPSKVFVMGGINGIKDISYSDFYEQYSDLCHVMIDSMPNAKIVLQSMLPIDSSRFDDYAPNYKIDSCNRIIEKLAIQYNLTFVDLYPYYIELQKQEQIYIDGIHLKKEYYRYWVEKIKVYLE